jgi:hypothetical protein
MSAQAAKTKFLWILERDERETESGIATLGELTTLLEPLSLHGLLPIDWVVELMANEESPEGHASHHHDANEPHGWTLSWSRLGQ